MNRVLRQLKHDLLAERKKVIMGGALLSVALLLWGRLLLKDPPRTAVADPKPDRVARADRPDRAAPPARRADDATARPVVEVGPLPSVGRDLFAFDHRHYPGAFPDRRDRQDLPKSDPGTVDQDVSRRASRRAVLDQASSLTLQSTMLGARSRALIDGVLLETGQTIRGFELIEVRARQVTLVKQGVEVTLEM